MKDYKQFANLNIEEIEPVEVTELEKKRVQHHVLGKKKKHPVWRKFAIAAVILLGATVTTPFAFPSLASQIPFMKNIVDYTNTHLLNSNFSDLATVIEQVQSSEGISIMIENAVFDGTSVSLTYAIETDKDLGEQPYVNGHFSVKSASGYAGTSSIEKINDTTYIGIEKFTPHFDKGAPEEILVRWNPYEIRTQAEVTYKGNWQFEFKLPKLQNEVKLVHATGQLDGVQIVVSSIEQNALSTIIHYEQYVDEATIKEWPHATSDIIEVKDNLGNVYSVNGNGGFSPDEGRSFELSITIDRLHPDATSLILTPQIYYSKGSGQITNMPIMEDITVDIQ
ncbi:DUF4179 domain-containing protein [Solibacillus sp. CAU 1738]|uniref:DUF4179 domain-containing protein n=1 Tax=Solibacillus sp. CAU 1738 TaxID=3140363 RepID=UPI003260B671